MGMYEVGLRKSVLQAIDGYRAEKKLYAKPSPRPPVAAAASASASAPAIASATVVTARYEMECVICMAEDVSIDIRFSLPKGTLSLRFSAGSSFYLAVTSVRVEHAARRSRSVLYAGHIFIKESICARADCLSVICVLRMDHDLLIAFTMRACIFWLAYLVVLDCPCEMPNAKVVSLRYIFCLFYVAFVLV